MTKSRKCFMSVAAGALLLAGCSSTITPVAAGPSAPPVTASASPNPSSMAMCDAFTQLKQSISGLGSLDVLRGGGLSAVKQAVDTVKTNLDAFQTAARSDFGPEITALRTSVSNLQTALSSAQASPSVATITQVAGNVAGVVTSFRGLRTAVSSRCG